MPYYMQKMRERLPQAELRSCHEVTTFFASDDQPGLDALVFAAERGSAWTLMYPKFSVVIPEPDLVKVPLAYPIGQRRPGVCDVRQYLDRTEAEGWYARRAL